MKRKNRTGLVWGEDQDYLARQRIYATLRRTNEEKKVKTRKEEFESKIQY